MATREEIGYQEADLAKSVDLDKVEEWGAYMCKSCNEFLKVPVFIYPPKDEGRWKGHCKNCERQTERERMDE